MADWVVGTPARGVITQYVYMTVEKKKELWPSSMCKWTTKVHVNALV